MQTKKYIHMITSMNKICTYHIYIIYVQNVFYTYIESWYRSVCVSVFTHLVSSHFP